VFSVNFYNEESSFYSSLHFPAKSPGKTKLLFPHEIHKIQKTGFEQWLTRRKQTIEAESTFVADTTIRQLMQRRFCKNDEYKDKYSVSSTSLNSYYKCPVNWLFEQVLQLNNETTEAEPIPNNITGIVFHAILCLFLTELKNSGKPVASPLNSGSEKKPEPSLQDSYLRLLSDKTETVFALFPCQPDSEFQQMSMLTARLLRAEKTHINTQLENFLALFISYFSGFRVIACETKYRHVQTNYYLNGIIDCILEDINGNLAVVDFKTNYMPVFSKCTKGELSNFQLPMYLRLAENKFTQEVHTATFFSVANPSPEIWFGSLQNVLSGAIITKKEEKRVTRGDDVFIHIMNEFDEKTVQFADKMTSGIIPAYPAYSPHCHECGYKKTCRVFYKICQEKNHDRL
jgi:ATP-dependent helicase/DNAse subunit B